jgi:hypothetical protein
MPVRQLLTRFLLPALIIVGLVLFQTLRERDRVLYELPQIEAFAAADADRVELSRGGRGIIVHRTDAGWVLEPGDFPADGVLMNTLLETLAQIRPTDLISQYGAYGRFELDPESALRVSAYQGEELLRTIDVGKQAGTRQHTYVRLAGDPRVYQARGNLAERFPFGPDALRDKVVLTFEPATVVGIVARSPGEVLALQRLPAEEDAAPQWATAAGAAWDAAKVEESLQRMAQLTTFRFADAAPAAGSEVLELTLTTDAGSVHEVRVFGRVDNSYPATSSGSAYPFLLFPWMVNGFLDAFTTAGAPTDESGTG